MCDVYVTPYLNEAQMTSGTLAYSFGLGKAVVSTPYWHAKELLGDGRGILVPFGDAKAISNEIAGLADKRRPPSRHAQARIRGKPIDDLARRRPSAISRSSRLRTRAGQREMSLPLGRSSFRERGQQQFRSCGSDISFRFATIRACSSTRSIQCRTAPMAIVSTTTLAPCCSQARLQIPANAQLLSEIGTTTLCSIHSARVESGHPSVPEFHELRPAMAGGVGLGRQPWPDALGLGRVRTHGHRSVSPQMGRGAFQDRASGCRDVLVAARLGLLASGSGCLLHAGSRRCLSPSGMRKLLADRLMALFLASQRKDWVWFEDVLAYDNARLSQALIQTGLATHTPAYVETGLRSLRWLMSIQTASSGCFRPVGSESFGKIRQMPDAFDQQPVEACGNDFCMPCRVACERWRGVVAGGEARIRLVSRQKRPADGAGRSRRPGVVRMACIRTEPMRTRVQNRCYRIFWVWWRCGSSWLRP